MTRISETENGFDLLNRNSHHKLNGRLRTFEIDSSLPPLPLPPLNYTLDKYLKSVRPFLTDLEYLATQKKVENFRNGVGKALQFHLKAKANREKNWLENWWLDWAYLEWREPIWPYINTSGILIDPNSLTDALERLKSEGINIQAARAAMAISFNIKFFDEIRNQTYPVHKSRSSYFSMAQFRRFYNTCRIPAKDKDKLFNCFKTADEGDCPTHIIVMYRNRFFKLDTFDRNKNMLEISDLYGQLNWILNSYGNNGLEDGIGIGALTADRRENWAKNREYLIGLSAANLEYFKLIEESLLMVNLDQDDCFTYDDITILGFLKNPKNRFFDKAYQLVLSKNGMVGSNIEHSPFDGMVTTTITAYSIDKAREVKIEKQTFEKPTNDRYLEKPTELEFVYDEKIKKEINSSVKLAETNCSAIEVKILLIGEYTKEKLKSFKINPDTVVQMALQLAYYQLHKKPAPTYETATTRAFYHGRTETVRSCSLEAVEWCKEMCNQDSSSRLNQRKMLELFKRACDRHESLMNEAKNSFGCDRHLLGLMLTSKELNLGLHEIFTDDAWKKSGGGGNFLISSSCVGFVSTVGVCAPFCLNGYSTIYSICDSGLLFGLGRYKQSEESHLEKFSQSLRAALNQIEHLIISISRL